MRLINCRTYKLEEFLSRKVPRYAILSHTWGEEEVTFADFTTNLAAIKSRPQFRKIRFTCRQARAEGIGYAWVDTVCIDKSSSAELSEAINSMFKWYADSRVCYAYLIDVTKDNFEEAFPQSRWFRRGWTLQELIAPHNVVFFDSAWQGLGSKLDHAHLIYNITQIDEFALIGRREFEDHADERLREFCVARKMAWASQRETTRVEDIAYCLLGIFNINMPLLYGEGDKAFTRLQKEIIKSFDDDSILAWGLMNDPVSAGMPDCVVRAANSIFNMHSILAKSPQDFANCHDVSPASNSISPFSMTNMGLQMELPLVPVQVLPELGLDYDPDHPPGWVALLTCRTSDISGILGIVLVPSESSDQLVYRGKILDGPGGLSAKTSVMTVVIGPRVAAQAVPMKITIVEQMEGFSVREYTYIQRQFIPMQTQAFRSFGYNVATAGGSHVPRANRDGDNIDSWNPSTEVLTLLHNPLSQDLVWLDFQSRNNEFCPEFTVLIRHNKLIVRRGISFSSEQLKECFDVLGQHGQDMGEEDLLLEDNEGQRKKVHVTMTSKRVHHLNIIQLSIDAVPCYPARKQKRRRISDETE